MENKINVIKKSEIPVFFSTDDNYVPYLVVAIRSLIDTASLNNNYMLYVLNTGLSAENKTVLKNMETSNVHVDFVDVTSKVKDIKEKLTAQLRDYYSPSIFYRLFIPSMFPKYKKTLYLDCDIVLVDDVANLYNIDLGDNLIGAVNDETVTDSDIFCYYTKNALGVEGDKYFNSGVILINSDKFRKDKIEQKFIYLLSNYNFGTVAPDQDYLNVLCKDRVTYINKQWDKMPIADPNFKEEDLKLIHYNMFQKPWKYEGVMYEGYFWEVAKKTQYYDFLMDVRRNYTDEKKEKDFAAGGTLLEYAKRIADDLNNFKRTLDKDCGLIAEKQNRAIRESAEINVLDDLLNFLFNDDEDNDESFLVAGIIGRVSA